jgi:hypothetical protein
MAKKTNTHVSHFVPRHLVNALAEELGYSKSTLSKIRRAVDSDVNTSETSARWNQSTNRKHEHQILKHLVGELDWNDLTAGAQRRFHEQANASMDLTREILSEAPEATGLVDALDILYGNELED